MKRWRKIVAGAAIAVAALGSQLIVPDNANAQVSYNTDWVGGRMMLRTDNGFFTSGTWLISASNLKTYLLIPAHSVRSCQSCPDLGINIRSRYEGSSVNWYDTLSVLDPINPAYEYYDFTLVDFGTSLTPPTNKWWYYCTALNCTSYQGGGTQKNANWAGSFGNLVGASAAQPGWGVVKSAAKSGTSWGTVVGATHLAYDGWDYWGIHYNGITGCGVTAGDSGAPVMTGPNNANSVYLGMHVYSLDFWWVPGPSPCYAETTRVASNGVFIAYQDVIAAYPGLSLRLYTGS